MQDKRAAVANTMDRRHGLRGQHNGRRRHTRSRPSSAEVVPEPAEVYRLWAGFDRFRTEFNHAWPCRPDRTEFEHVWAKLGSIPANNTGPASPNVYQVRRILECRPAMAGFGRSWTDLDQDWRISSKFGPMLVRSRPNPAEVVPESAKVRHLGRVRPIPKSANFGRIRPESTQVCDAWAAFDRVCTELNHKCTLRPKTGLDHVWGELGPSSANTGSTSSNVCQVGNLLGWCWPTVADFGRSWTGLDQNWQSSSKSGPMLAVIDQQIVKINYRRSNLLRWRQTLTSLELAKFGPNRCSRSMSWTTAGQLRGSLAGRKLLALFGRPRDNVGGQGLLPGKVWVGLSGCTTVCSKSDGPNIHK